MVDILEPVSHFLEAARENLSLKICRSLKITKLPTFTVPHCRVHSRCRKNDDDIGATQVEISESGCGSPIV
nr:hypothetical protein [Tanacetum cinerariifolium]